MITKLINESIETKKLLLNNTTCINKIKKLIDLCISSIKNNGKIIFAGNGGSFADAQHISAELVGRYKKERKGLPAIAFTTDTSIITAVANDMGYNKIFERQISALANENDILFGISTSGESLSVINAVKVGKKMNVKSISLTGMQNNTLSSISDISLQVPSNSVNHIQELHILVGHFICEMIDKSY